MIDADLYVVLTGCIPEIVGDDSGEVVSRAGGIRLLEDIYTVAVSRFN